MNQYDKIAKKYFGDKRTNHPQLKYVIYPSWLSACGEIKGLRVLDLGCGSGHTSRLLAEKGAIVVGVDESVEQLRLARDKEIKKSFGINYRKANAKALPLQFAGNFDLVTPTFLLHYAKNEAELLVFIKEVYRILKKNRKMVAININPKNPIYFNTDSNATKKWIGKPFQEGSQIEVGIRDAFKKQLCTCVVYYWSKKLYEKCFRKAGFVNVEWIDLKMTEKGKELFQNWRKLENCHSLVLLTAQKS